MIGINKAGLNSSIHLDSIAGVTPAGDVVIIINNSDVNANYSVTITNKRGENLNLVLEARSFTTIVYKDV
jgi:O-glycosyl hydrolase